jgi:large subunit ribosomal protein L9
MEIILLQDVQKLGYKDDVLKVKDGYANNYLIPQGYAIMATKTNLKIHAENMRQRAFKEDKIRNEASAMAQKLEGLSVRIGAKVGNTGKIFGSVNAIQISDALKEQHNIEIDRKRIVVDGDSVKEVGTYKAKINLHKEVKGEISFEVFAE